MDCDHGGGFRTLAGRSQRALNESLQREIRSLVRRRGESVGGSWAARPAPTEGRQICSGGCT